MEALSSHSSYLLQQLQEQRIQGLLCDCMLVVKGVCFKAHKNVLAAFSSYFRSLFQNSPSQKNEVFNLVIQDVGGIGQVLDYMYTSHLDVNQDNVQALLDIAQCLQVPNIQNMCNAFLKPCPPPAETPPFSLPAGALTSEHHLYDVVTSLPHDMDLHCPAASSSSSEVLQRPSFNADLDHAKKLSASVAHSGANCEIADKQLAHSYKLRNFYSKQYFKQSAVETSNAASNQGPSPLVMMDEQQYQAHNNNHHPTVCAGSTGHPNPPCTAAAPVEKTTNMAPDETLTAPADPADSALDTPVRPKKTVYLKKYNYLRSQKTLEEMCAEPLSEPVLLAGPKESSPREREQSPVQNLRPPEAPGADCLAEIRDEAPEAAPETQSPTPPPPAAHEEQEPKTVSSSPPLQTGHKQYCCEVCGKIFKHPSNLMLHKRMHTGEKPFQCNVCGKNFSQAGNLQTHLRRHSGEKPYICELCGKSFAAAGDVQRHIVIHTGEKPHLCDICGRGFSNFSNLKEHKKTHTADQTCTCDQCGKSFNMEKKLLKHKARHVGEKTHRCDTCGKCFIDSGDLRRHVRSHTGERPYLCNACGKSFTRCALLRRHSSTNCRGAPPPPEGSAEQSSSGSDQTASSFPKPVGQAIEMLAQPGREKQQPSSSSSSPALARPKHQDTPPPPPGETTTHLCPAPTSSSGSLPELRSLVPPHLLSSAVVVHQERCPTNPAAGASEEEGPPRPPANKPHHLLPQEEAVYGHYAEESGGGKPSSFHLLPPVDAGHCVSVTASSRAGGGGAPYRAGDGQFISSVTLWGLAMKTLQNENDMEQ